MVCAQAGNVNTGAFDPIPEIAACVRERGGWLPVDGALCECVRGALAGSQTPVMVCAQAGNVNTGAFDPIPEIAACVRERGGWLHVDGAFGLWAAASPKYRSLVEGVSLADSVSVDCHKWLNVPYDCGLVFVRDAAAHLAAMTLHAPYYVTAPGVERDNSNWVPEASRRARGFTVYAALRALGRRGLAEVVERCCGLAQRMAERLSKGKGVRVLNEVVLNQVLVRFSDPSAGDDAGCERGTSRAE